MLNPFAHRLRKPKRRYPVRRDDYGRSARQQAFEAFNQGKKPAEAADMVGITKRTARRYFAAWKKLPRNFETRYSINREMLRNDTELSNHVIDMLVESLDMPREEVIARLKKPWAIKQLMLGKWPNYRQDKIYSQQEARLQAALKIIRFAEYAGMPPEKVASIVQRLFSEALEYKARQEG